MSETTYVVIGGGSQLAEVLREERRYGQAVYLALPLNCGAGDPYGMYAQWRPASSTPVADMSQWTYDARLNRWSKVR